MSKRSSDGEGPGGPGGPRDLAKPVGPYAGMTADARVERAVIDIRAEWARAVGAFGVIGRTLVDACHDGDAASALAPEADRNDLFRRIARSLGTMKGGPTRKTLSLARRVVAASANVRGHFWDVVPYGHKEILVLLAHAPAKMVTGAQRAVELAWTQDQLRKWVDAERARDGSLQRKRGRGLARTRLAVGGLGAAGEPASLDRIVAGYAKLDPKDRRKFRDEIAVAEKAIAALRKRFAAVDR